MNDFVDATDQIRDAFKTPTSVAWARSTGRRAMANALLAAMRNARSQEQFDNLAYQFKRDVLMPYYREVVMSQGSPSQRTRFLERNSLMQMRPRKPMGTYEELQKNPAFAQSRFKHLPRGAQDSVPSLLRIAQDPAEMDLAAREMGVTPEDLQAHIQDAYGQRAREQFRKDMMAAAMEGQRYRDALAEDYEKSLIGRVLGTISPEVTGLRLKEIRTGTESSNWDLAKAIAKDALVGIGSLYTGGIAGKVVSNPMAQAALGGVFDASLEAARQGMSDYYDWDPANIAATGGVSATLPVLIGGLASMGSSIPGVGRLTRPIMRKLRMMQADPAEQELKSRHDMIAASRNAIEEAYESGNQLMKEGADDILEKEVRPFVEESPWETGVPESEKLSKEKLVDLTMDDDAVDLYFNPPSKEDFAKMASRKAAGDKYAEEWLDRAKAQWPQNWKKASTPEPRPTKLDKIVDFAVDAASREETMRQRTEGRKLEDKSATTALRQVMEYDPDMIMMWKTGFVPNDVAGKKLYDEWKEKFGGQQ